MLALMTSNHFSLFNKNKMLGRFLLDKIKDREVIVKIIHRHWFNILKQFFPIFLLVLILVTVFNFLPSYFSVFQEGSLSKFLTFGESLFAVVLWTFIFFVWIDYYFDIWVITSEKIINIEQKGLFMRSLSELKFEKIQDVTVEVKGLLPTILNYGDVFIQTAGEKERFIFRQVPDPYKIKDLVMSLQKVQKREETNDLGEMIRQEIHKEIM
jgi:uncharacterized membrane protein YdbT with pleckstrin-like domain